MRRVKSIILILLCAALVFSSASCIFDRDMPDSVEIDGKVYKKTFTGSLYPTDDSFPYTEEQSKAKISGATYYKYTASSFDCFVTYYKGLPYLYFESESYDNALSFYTNGDNFKYFCITGNLHDENDHEVFELKEIDYSRFEELIDFFLREDYNPIGASDNDDDLIKAPLIDRNNWTDYEIRFYKESLDGLFTTSKGHTLIQWNDRLYLLYYYDWGDDDNPVMCIKEMPAELSEYFTSVLENLE